MRGVWRRAELEDLDALVDVQHAGAVAGLGEVFDQQRHPFPRAEVRDRWSREMLDPTITCLVADRDGVLVAFAAVRSDELVHFGTAVSTWGSGLASMVLEELITTWMPSGRLRLWVFEANRRGRRFYAKHGWVPSGAQTRSGFAPHPVLLEYVLDRDLSSNH